MLTISKIFLLYTLLKITHVESEENVFPDGFKIGVATSAYQIEGGWNADGKGESIWDRLSHTHPDFFLNQSTGDVACDYYHLYQKDLELIKDLGVDHYRFSLSWTRILPEGFSNKINQKGVDYYNNIIDTLIANGIEPLVTLYHWDLPQVLQELGGWTNPQTAVYFEDYTRVAFELFGDRVKNWITINEPHSICYFTYEIGGMAPADVKTPGIGLYLCGKTVLLAHARAYRLYDKEFREKQGGKVGITIDNTWYEPETNATEDIEAADREIQMDFGWWAHPIFSETGNYPEVMISRVEEMSRKENFSESRLPPFTTEEIDLIRGTADFFGLNHYNTMLTKNNEYPSDASPSFDKDKGTSSRQDPDWKPSPDIVPWGFRKLLNWVKNEYKNPLVIITENGYGAIDGTLEDDNRVLYLKEYLKALLSAVNEDGCNVQGYTLWTLMDDLEWRAGFLIKYGLYEVNFSSPNLTRTPRSSLDFYKNVIKTRTVPDN